MRYLMIISLLLTTAFLGNGCAGLTSNYPSGNIYEGTVFPMRQMMQAEHVSCKKVGKATVRGISIIFVGENVPSPSVAFGDAGIKKAMQDGGISRIHHVDQEIFSILFGLYTQRTFIVYGE